MWVLYDTTWQDKSGASRSSTVSAWPGEAAKEMLVTCTSAGNDADGAGTTELTATTASPRLADGTVSESYWAWRAVSKFKVLMGHSLGREQGTQPSSLHIMTSIQQDNVALGTQMGSWAHVRRPRESPGIFFSWAFLLAVGVKHNFAEGERFRLTLEVFREIHLLYIFLLVPPPWVLMTVPLYRYLWPPVTSTDFPPPWFTSSCTCCHCWISLPAGHSPAHSIHWLPSWLPFQCKCSPVLVLVCTGKVKVKVAQLCPTFCDPMDYTVHEILQARVLEWVAIPFSRGSSQPRDRTQVSHTADGFFTSWATREVLEFSVHWNH